MQRNKTKQKLALELSSLNKSFS